MSNSIISDIQYKIKILDSNQNPLLDNTGEPIYSKTLIKTVYNPKIIDGELFYKYSISAAKSKYSAATQNNLRQYFATYKNIGFVFNLTQNNTIATIQPITTAYQSNEYEFIDHILVDYEYPVKGFFFIFELYGFTQYLPFLINGEGIGFETNHCSFPQSYDPFEGVRFDYFAPEDKTETCFLSNAQFEALLLSLMNAHIQRDGEQKLEILKIIQNTSWHEKLLKISKIQKNNSTSWLQNLFKKPR